MSRWTTCAWRVQSLPSGGLLDAHLSEGRPGSRISRNAIYNLLGQIMLLALGLLSARFLFHGLGEDTFGLILFATTLSATLSGLLELGLIATTVRAVAVHRSDVEYLNSYAATGSSVYWGLYLVLVSAVWMLAPTIVGHWIRLHSLSSSTAIDLLRMLLAAALTALPRNLYSSLFRGFERMEINNGIEVGAGAAQQAGTIVVLLLGGGALLVGLWILFVAILALAAYIIALTHFLAPRALLPGYSHPVVRDSWRFAANVSGNSILVALFMQSDKLVVSKLLPLSAFGYYNFAASSVWRVAALATVVSQAAFPSLAKLRSQADPGLLVRYRRLDDLVCHVFAIPMATVAFAAWPVFRYLFGDRVANDLLLPVGLLAVAHYMYATLTMPMALASASGHPELITKVNALALFTFLPALIGLVALWGLMGAAVAWLTYYCLNYAYLIPHVYRRCLNRSPLGWYSRTTRVYLRLAGSYGVAWSVCFAVYRHETAAWVLGLLVATALFTLLACPMVTASVCGQVDQSPSSSSSTKSGAVERYLT